MKKINWNKVFLYYYRKTRSIWLAEQKVTRAAAWATVNNPATNYKHVVGFHKLLYYHMNKGQRLIDVLVDIVMPAIERSGLPKEEKNRLLEMYYADPEEK